MKKSNQVSLVGRISGEPVERELPSGDKVVTFRLVVPREEGGVDTIDCSAWTSVLRRKALTMCDSEAQLTGALRRRFWQNGKGVASRYEVETLTLERVRR